MTNLVKVFIEKMTVNFLLLLSSKAVKQIVANFTEIKGGLFVGIREYTTKAQEVANHVINVNFSYGKAVENDVKKLQDATNEDVMNIVSKFSVDADLVKQAIEKLLGNFIKNQNKETQSNQSKAQNEAYINICPSIKMNKETKNFHIYGLRVSKNILVEGEYKEVKSRPLTIAQNAVKKYFDFTTTKYKNYIIDADMLTAVAINKNIIELK